jgi:hypothetical protein
VDVTGDKRSVYMELVAKPERNNLEDLGEDVRICYNIFQ